MGIFAASSAGRSTERHFKHLRRRWRRRMAATLALAGGAFFLAAMLAVRFFPWQPTFTAGLLTGCALALLVWAWDDPPEVIAKWRRGSQGEQATARALRALGPDWYVRHDVQGGFGNLDHILVGPGGFFLLDSKNLSGRTEVQEGVLHVRFPNSPADDRAYTGLPRAVFGAAAGLRERVKHELGWIVDVHPVVVLTGLYPQRRAEAGRLVYLAVDELVPWLAEQPRRVAPQDVEAIRAIVTAMPAARDLARAGREAD
jgi:hypothetical protein